MSAAAEGDAGEVVALSLRPLGGRFVEPLPARVLDYAVEVPAYGDRFVAGNLREQVELLARARAMDVPAGTRLLVERDELDLDTVVAALLVPLVVDGSVVLVRNADAQRRPARIQTERVTTQV